MEFFGVVLDLPRPQASLLSRAWCAWISGTVTEGEVFSTSHQAPFSIFLVLTDEMRADFKLCLHNHYAIAYFII